jgi:hypothetical protein
MTLLPVWHQVMARRYMQKVVFTLTPKEAFRLSIQASHLQLGTRGLLTHPKTALPFLLQASKACKGSSRQTKILPILEIEPRSYSFIRVPHGHWSTLSSIVSKSITYSTSKSLTNELMRLWC